MSPEPRIEYYQMLIREKGLTPPIYPPPPGMVLPMPKLPAATAPKPAAATLPGLGLPGMLPTMPKLPGVPAFQHGEQTCVELRDLWMADG